MREAAHTAKRPTTKIQRGIIGLLVLCCSLLPLIAQAHNQNLTGVKVRLEANSVGVSVIAHDHALQTGDVAEEIAQRLKLRVDGKPFVPQNIRVIADKANGIVMWQAQQPGAARAVVLEAPLFPERTRESTVLTVFKNQQVIAENVLRANGKADGGAGNGREQPQVASSKATVAWQFLCEGILHIFGGIDHVLFIVSLLLLGGSRGHLLKIVTAFTIAHSITLSLAATGTFSLPPRFVEPVIALSIVAVAIGNILTFERERRNLKNETTPKRTDLRPWMAFGFGLIHGFGFAGALIEIGLPREALGWALVAFNVGVELGQFTIVLVCAPLLAAVVKGMPKLQRPLVLGGSTAVASISFVWFVQRLSGV